MFEEMLQRCSVSAIDLNLKLVAASRLALCVMSSGETLEFYETFRPALVSLCCADQSRSCRTPWNSLSVKQITRDAFFAVHTSSQRPAAFFWYRSRKARVHDSMARLYPEAQHVNQFHQIPNKNDKTNTLAMDDEFC